MRKQPDDQFDKLFRERIENYEKTPPTQIWNHIHDAMDEAVMDDVFKRKLGQQEIEPRPEVWLGVARRLPIHLRLKIALQHLSKVAAVLLLGFIATWAAIQWQNHEAANNSVAESTTQHQPAKGLAPVASADAPVAFLNVPNTPYQRSLQVKSPQPSETKALLDAILADNESFTAKIDTKKIQQVLQPIDPIAFDESVANLSDALFLPPAHPDDLIIRVELTVVDQDEVAGLLRKYEEYQQHQR